MSTLPPDILAAAAVLWDYHCTPDPLGPADAIVGLGSYDLRVADRCAALFDQGLAPRILFTGASGNWTSGLYQHSEAAAFAARARTRGVPDCAITLEETATNIGENLTRAAASLPGAATLILVTKPQTQRRVRATAKAQIAAIQTMVTAPDHGLQDQPTGVMDMTGLINEMVGDLQRMRDYPARGFQAPEPIPDSVATAFDQLVAAGYTAHLS